MKCDEFCMPKSDISYLISHIYNRLIFEKSVFIDSHLSVPAHAG